MPDVSPPAPTVLATLDMPAYAVAVDNANVYWTQGFVGFHDPSPTFAPWPVAMQCSKTTCVTPTRLATGIDLPLSIGVDADAVYWSSYSFIYPGPSGVARCSIGGCNQKPDLWGNGPAHSVAIGGGYLLWRTSGSDVDECSTGGCAGTLATVAQDAVGGVVTDGAYAYWSTDSQIERCSLGPVGCNAPPTVVAPEAPVDMGSSFGVPNYRAIAVDDKNIYWQSSNAIVRCAKQGCASPTVLKPTQAYEVQCIASDGVNVYWNGSGALVRCPVTGCDRATTLFWSHDDGFGVNCFAVDDTSIYITTGDLTDGAATPPASGGHILRLAK